MSSLKGSCINEKPTKSMQVESEYVKTFLLNTVFFVNICQKNIQLTLDYLKGPFLVLHFSYHTLILLYMLMMLLSTLNVIRHLICGSNQNWLLNLNLIYETLDWGRKWLVDFNTGKTKLVSFDQSNNTGAIHVKMHGSVLEKKIIF